MKHLPLLFFAALFLLSCQKDIQHPEDNYMVAVKKGLTDSLQAADLERLDFSRAARSRVDSVRLFFVRVPFRDKNRQEEFVFVKTDEMGKIEKGKIVRLKGTISDLAIEGRRVKSWDGDISMFSLDRRTHFQSAIQNGYITAFHPQSSYRAAVHPAPDVMPEVIITYTIPSGGGGSPWSSWFMLHSLTTDAYSGNGGGYYSSFSGGETTGGGGGGGNSSGGTNNPGGNGATDPVMQVDMEMQDEEDPIDIEKFINCFNAIPDAGATCSIEILADIPVDSDPNKIFNFTSRSPGHTFLNIRKSNGSQSVSQNVGFYPKDGWKVMFTNTAINGKLVDNGQHEFNAGFKITITPAQLQSAITEMQRSKNYKYDLDNYNCTDWALDVFNAAGGNLQIPLYDVPGNYLSTGTRMPNGVYNKLQEMKMARDPRAGGITMNIKKGFAGNSTGPCN